MPNYCLAILLWYKNALVTSALFFGGQNSTRIETIIRWMIPCELGTSDAEWMATRLSDHPTHCWGSCDSSALTKPRQCYLLERSRKASRTTGIFSNWSGIPGVLIFYECYVHIEELMMKILLRSYNSHAFFPNYLEGYQIPHGLHECWINQSEGCRCL